VVSEESVPTHVYLPFAPLQSTPIIQGGSTFLLEMDMLLGVGNGRGEWMGEGRS
jgi:hypothetical protein